MQEKATFAAGCFWGVENTFMKIPGVISTRVGYIGGKTKDPTYETVCSGGTGHKEAVEITFDPKKVSYEELLNTFWSSHNPTTQNQQGPDIGEQYHSVVFYHNAEQEKLAREIKKKLANSGAYSNPIVTDIESAPEFYEAEEYHQKYLQKMQKTCSSQ